MNLFSRDLSVIDFNLNFSDQIFEPYVNPPASSSNSTVSFQGEDNDTHAGLLNSKKAPNLSPPKHRHDGTSPLPLGMDWSPPPRKWDGRDTVWPHDPHSGWSYCVTIPSWTFLPKSRRATPVVFYRVQVAVQSPESITCSHGIVRRFTEFLKLFYDLKKAFPKKNLPIAPPKRILKMKSPALLEDRRSSLEDWMEKLLSDIDVSRSAPVAIFLDLEAAVRSYHQTSDEISSTSDLVSPFLPQTSSEISVFGANSYAESDYSNDTPYEVSELGTPRHGDNHDAGLGMEKSYEQDVIKQSGMTFKNIMSSKKFFRDRLERISRLQGQKINAENTTDIDKVSENPSDVKILRMDGTEFTSFAEDFDPNAQTHSLSAERINMLNSELVNLLGDTSLENHEGSGAARSMDDSRDLDFQFPPNLCLAFASYGRVKLNRVLNTFQQRLATARTDMEDLIARLNQEVAVRQFLATKVKDLEMELDITKQSCKESMQQAVLTEKDKYLQMQWDIEELKRKCLDVEMKLEFEKEEKLHAESTKLSVLEENEILRQELNATREQLKLLQKDHEEFEVKSKAEVKLLVKEIKTLRSSQSDLKQELSQLMKQKIELERALQKEKQRVERANIANLKLLHECGMLHNRLQECSVNFLVEEEDKLIMDTSSPSDAIDLLATSDNRIGLLLAEAQLLAQEVESMDTAVDETHSPGLKVSDKRAVDDALRKMLIDVFVDNANLRMQVNSVIRCTLNTNEKSDEDVEEEIASRKTVLSKFLER